ncbi:MAG: IPT/TIG domain-containing protein [Labilithrix sp.]|nr:IPT/TIG domain-containing protein [Labilithrix sp.]
MGFGAHLSLVGKSAGAAPAPALTVVSVSPSTGPAAGGTSVTIHGTGFEPGMHAVFFTGDGSYVGDGDDVSVLSPTQITCRTPEGPPGAVWVGVGVIGDWEARHAFLPDGFTFESAGVTPVLTALDYDLAEIGGGARLTVKGTDLDAVDILLWDGGSNMWDTIVTARSATSITFVFPDIEEPGSYLVRAAYPNPEDEEDSLFSNAIPIEAFARSSLNLSGWFEGFAFPWSSRASAGTSGSRSLNSQAGSVTSTTLNGHAAASFAGSGSYLQDTSVHASSYLTTAEYAVSILCRPKSPAAPAANVYDEPAIIGENGAAYGLVWNTKGVAWYHGDGSYKVTPYVPVTPNTWVQIDVRCLGGVAGIRVNGGAWRTVSVSALASLAVAFRVGAGYSTSAIVDVASVTLSQVGLDDTTLTKVRRALGAKYHLPLWTTDEVFEFEDDTTISVRGPGLGGATVTLDGVTMTPTESTSNVFTFVAPTKAAGTYDMVVTGANGTTKTFAIEYWSAGSTAGLLSDLNPRHAVVDSGVVLVLPDGSGNGFDATAPTGHEPTYTASVGGYAGKPTVYFPTADELGGGAEPAKVLDQTSDIATAIYGDRVTLFLVGHVVATAGNKYWIMTTTGAPVGAYVGGNLINAYANGTYTPLIGNDADVSAPKVIGIAFDDDNSARMYLGRKTPAVSEFNLTGKATTGFRLGCWQTSQAQWSASGHIARVLIFKGSLDQGQCEGVMSALGRLYGLSIGT